VLSLLGGLAESIGRFVLNAIIDGINLLIVAVGALIGVVMALLPNMPAVPEPPDDGFLHTFAYFFPVGGVVALLGLFVTAYIAVLVVRIALRWVKAL
jgi:hypothetical protein